MVDSNDDKRPKRKVRCIDFPSYAYEKKTSKANVMVTIRKKNQAPPPPPTTGYGRAAPADAAKRDDGEEYYNYYDKTQAPLSISAKDIYNNDEEEEEENTLWRSRVGTFVREPERAIAASALRTRLLRYRSYAKSESFLPENLQQPPSIHDFSQTSSTPRDLAERLWIGSPVRIGVLVSSYLAFPYITRFLDHYVTTLSQTSPQDWSSITSNFGPGISILYGTFISLTLSILYRRQQSLQERVAVESSLLLIVAHNVLDLFGSQSRESAIDAAQCIADQVRTLVRSSRGKELMALIYSDPYARLLELVKEHETAVAQANARGGGGRIFPQSALIGYTRDVLQELIRTRATRLSDEALALPPTHYVILTILTILILLGYTVSILPTVDPTSGMPSVESSCLFSVLCTTYVLFYFFANDLNNPFEGVYQIRRSATAAHLLQLKWLLANHPLVRGEVDFEEMQEVDERRGAVQIRSPGLGDIYLQREDFYPPDPREPAPAVDDEPPPDDDDNDNDNNDSEKKKKEEEEKGDGKDSVGNTVSTANVDPQATV